MSRLIRIGATATVLAAIVVSTCPVAAPAIDPAIAVAVVEVGAHSDPRASIVPPYPHLRALSRNQRLTAFAAACSWMPRTPSP